MRFYGMTPGAQADAARAANTVKLMEWFGGKIEDKAAFQNALERAPFKSVRGEFKFNTNHFPIQNFYLTKIEKNEQGEVVPILQDLIASDVKDAYADQCAMKAVK